MFYSILLTKLGLLYRVQFFLFPNKIFFFVLLLFRVLIVFVFYLFLPVVRSFVV